MTSGRAASLVATCDQWVRATHSGTAVEGTRGELLLSWTEPPPADSPAGAPCTARGMATDRLCRVYRLTGGVLERVAVGPTAAGVDYVGLPPPVVVVGGGPTAGRPGPEFGVPGPPALLDATGIAVDDDDRLFLADRARRTVSVLDLWSRRLLRTVQISSTRHPGRYPAGLAARGTVVHAVVRRPAGLLRLRAGSGPEEMPLPDAVAGLPGDAEPVRVAVLPGGEPVLLCCDTTGRGWLVAGNRPAREVGAASDVVVDAAGAVVVAPCPSADGRATLRRLVPTAGGWTRAHPLDATGYDGTGVVLTRDGRVGYSTAAGVRLAVVAPVAYRTDGHCVTYRLDSGTPRNRWGRLLVAACVPDGTECLVGTASSDDDAATALPHRPPEPAACSPGTAPSPPLPPPGLVPSPGTAEGRLHRRGDPVTPWWPADPAYATFEAPVTAPPGRFLWVTLRLRGNRRRTPRVRELRVEHTAHGLLRRLPRVFSAEEPAAGFLHRYLAGPEGFLHDLDLRSACRDVLVDPSGTPAEALEWLASFVGLVLDDRWAEPARRRLVAEIVPLYRRRGTPWALARYLAIHLAGEAAGDPGHAWVQPVVVEHFRLRGLGGPLVGDVVPGSTRSVVGAGFRVGGEVGTPGTAAPTKDSAAFAGAAHRFTVLIPQPLSADQDGAVRHVLDTERPAHTAYELCTVDAGMRVGAGLHLGLSSIVGPTGALAPAVLDRTALGRGGLLGGAATGVAVEAARVGSTARVG